MPPRAHSLHCRLTATFFAFPDNLQEKDSFLSLHLSSPFCLFFPQREIQVWNGLFYRAWEAVLSQVLSDPPRHSPCFFSPSPHSRLGSRLFLSFVFFLFFLLLLLLSTTFFLPVAVFRPASFFGLSCPGTLVLSAAFPMPLRLLLVSRCELPSLHLPSDRSSSARLFFFPSGTGLSGSRRVPLCVFTLVLCRVVGYTSSSWNEEERGHRK